MHSDSAIGGSLPRAKAASINCEFNEEAAAAYEEYEEDFFE